MSSENPYAPPPAPVSDQDDEASHLAGRGQRLAAAILDGVIGIVCAIPIMVLFGMFDYLKAGRPLPFTLTLASTVSGIVLFVVVHGYLLKTHGQTVGKKLIGVRIVDLDNQLPRFGKLIGLRYLPIWAVTVIPVIGQILPLIDALFIFRKDRRCLHDLIAGTRVVRAS